MTHGLPDYYRGVDIAYQALAQLMVRPTYGEAESAYGGAVMVATAENILQTVTGKGMIYGGVLYLDYIASQKHAQPLLYIDDVKLDQPNFEDLYKWKIAKENSLPFYLLRYDEGNYIYAVGLSSGYTFEESFKINYNEVNEGTPTVYYDILYALIT